MRGDVEMNAGHFEQISDCWLLEEQPATYYRSVEARARMLRADATSPRMRQYLDIIIAHCKQLAVRGEQPASRPLDRPGCVDQPRRKIRQSARAFRIISRPDQSRLAPDALM